MTEEMNVKVWIFMSYLFLTLIIITTLSYHEKVKLRVYASDYSFIANVALSMTALYYVDIYFI